MCEETKKHRMKDTKKLIMMNFSVVFTVKHFFALPVYYLSNVFKVYMEYMELISAKATI